MTSETMTEARFWVWKDALLEALRAAGHIEDCSAQGDCEEACFTACKDAHVDEVLMTGLRAGAGPRIACELRETGGWARGEVELYGLHEGKHDSLMLARFVWILCCDERENARGEG